MSLTKNTPGKNRQAPDTRWVQRLRKLVAVLGLLGVTLWQPGWSQTLADAAPADFKLNLEAPFTQLKVEQLPRYTMQENGTDIPYDVAPARIRFTLETGAGAPATLEVIPLRDPTVKQFDAAYPDLAFCTQGIRKILRFGNLDRKINRDLPVWNYPDAAQTIHAKTEIIKSAWCSGILFLTCYTQEAGTPIDNESLALFFQGLSNDGKYYIAATFPVTQAELPQQGEYQGEDQAGVYYLKMEQMLDRADDASYTPSLATIRKVIHSLAPVQLER